MSINLVDPPYQFDLDKLASEFLLGDHFLGFNSNLENDILNRINDYAVQKNKKYTVVTDQIFSDEIHSKYPHLAIKFSLDALVKYSEINSLRTYSYHPEIDYKNFICSFNGTMHVSRKLLVAILHKLGYFNPIYSTKNIVFTVDSLDGNITDVVGTQDSLYRKFFIGDSSDKFFNTIHTFEYIRGDHDVNVCTLENRLTQSFLHIVSETLGTSYYPYVTEKFLYSIVTRGLFLAYGQPGWHKHIENYYGFKLYDKIFDYGFDQVRNPVQRLVRLMEMVSKFANLSLSEWKDLYMIERDTIEYNYDHYISGAYLKELEKHDNYRQ